MTPPHAVVICLGPSPLTGPSSAVRDDILSVWLPGGGKPQNTPRHHRDSEQSGSLTSAPGQRLGARKRTGAEEDVHWVICSCFHACIHSFLASTSLCCEPGGGVLTALPALSCPFSIPEKADLVTPQLPVTLMAHLPATAFHTPCRIPKTA